MFEVGWSEYLLIFGLALVVLGPEKLPKLAASIGRWVGRARVMARQFRDQLETEADSISAAVGNVKRDFESAASDIQAGVTDVKQEFEAGMQEPPDPAPQPEAAQPETPQSEPAPESAAAESPAMSDTAATVEMPAPPVPEDHASPSTPGEVQDERRL